MRLQFLLAGLLALSAVVSTAVAKSPTGALYFATNSPDGNSIVTNTLDCAGDITFYNNFSTHANGSLSYSTMPGKKYMDTDSLESQGSLAVSGDLLAVVNAGSNSISLFSIDTSNPSIIYLEDVISSNGSFPMSVALNAGNKIACVLNGGGMGSVMCYRVTNRKMHPINGSYKQLSLNQSTPPLGPPGTASQIGFSNDGLAVFVSIKGHPKTGSNGYMAAWPVYADGSLGDKSIADPPMGAKSLPFGFVQSGWGTIFASDAGYGLSTFEYKNNNLSFKASLTIPKQMASCWIQYAPRSDTFVIVDTAVGALYQLAPDYQGSAKLVGNYTIQKESVDAKIVSSSKADYLYILNGKFQTVTKFTVQSSGMIKQEGMANYTMFDTELQGLDAYIV